MSQYKSVWYCICQQSRRSPLRWYYCSQFNIRFYCNIGFMQQCCVVLQNSKFTEVYHSLSIVMIFTIVVVHWTYIIVVVIAEVYCLSISMLQLFNILALIYSSVTSLRVFSLDSLNVITLVYQETMDNNSLLNHILQNLNEISDVKREFILLC